MYIYLVYLNVTLLLILALNYSTNLHLCVPQSKPLPCRKRKKLNKTNKQTTPPPPPNQRRDAPISQLEIGIGQFSPQSFLISNQHISLNAKKEPRIPIIFYL